MVTQVEGKLNRFQELGHLNSKEVINRMQITKITWEMSIKTLDNTSPRCSIINLKIICNHQQDNNSRLDFLMQISKEIRATTSRCPLSGIAETK